MVQKDYGKTHYGKLVLTCNRCNKKYKPGNQGYGYLDQMGFCIWCAGNKQDVENYEAWAFHDDKEISED